MVVPRERWRRIRERLGAVPRRAVFAALAAVVLAASAVAVASGSSRGRRTAVPAAVAAAFGYPLRCLTVTVSGSFAHAHIDRSGTCARFRGYLNASFHLIDGRWRLVLDEGQLFVPNALLVGTR